MRNVSNKRVIRLTEERKLRRLYIVQQVNSGRTKASLARELGVSSTRIHQLYKSETYYQQHKQ